MVETSFNNVFNLLTDDLNLLEIRENLHKDNCFIWHKEHTHLSYSSVILDENQRTKIICEFAFHRSSKTNKYIPRLSFKKVDKTLKTQETDATKPVNIAFNNSTKPLVFWKFIDFLYGHHELFDIGGIQKTLQKAEAKNSFIESSATPSKAKMEALWGLHQQHNFEENEVNAIIIASRKKQLNGFLYLLKNQAIQEKNSIDLYKEKYDLKTKEAVWQHFLTKNKWMFGSLMDSQFINESSSETNSYNDYTTLIEIKDIHTPILERKSVKIWEFSTQFMEGFQTSLRQDNKTIFIIGNGKKEFSKEQGKKIFERFRKNNAVQIQTFDELFEQAYYIVFGKRIAEDWWKNENFKVL